MQPAAFLWNFLFAVEKKVVKRYREVNAPLPRRGRKKVDYARLALLSLCNSFVAQQPIATAQIPKNDKNNISPILLLFVF